MSVDHFNSLRDRRCTLWVEAEAAIISLTERANSHSRNGTVLGWLTVGFGVLAGGSGLAFITNLGVGEEAVAPIFGFVTASIAAINQGYNPSEKEKDLLEKRNEIFIVQRDIKNDLWKLQSKAPITVDDDFEVEQASDKLDEHLIGLTGVESHHQDTASSNLDRKKYNVMQYKEIELPEMSLDGPAGVEAQMVDGGETTGVERFGRGA